MGGQVGPAVHIRAGPAAGRARGVVLHHRPPVADGGDHERAERIALSIPDDRRRADALLSLAARAPAQRVGRLAGLAFGAGSWLLPLPVLAKRRPDVLVRIAEDALRDDLALDEE